MTRQVTIQNNFVPLTKLLNKAFATIAEEFGLTKEHDGKGNTIAPLLKK